MQIVNQNNIEERLLFYWSKMYTQSIKAGDDYKSLQKSIVILFSDYNLENLKEVPEYLTKWKIREENHQGLILTDKLELYIIELQKVKDNSLKINKELNSWLQFINNPKAVSDMENEEIKKAKKILEEISKDEKEQWLTELREKYILDQKAVESYGFDKGLEQGLEQGISKEKNEIAKKLKEKGMTTEEIMEITGLTKEEIEKI